MAAIAAATIGSFLSFGLPLLKNEVGARFQQEVDIISRELKYIRAHFKDDFIRSAGPGAVREEWLEDMRLLAYDIEDFTDRFLSRFKPRGNLLRRAWRSVAIRIHIGGTIGELKDESAKARELFSTYKMDKDESAPTITKKASDEIHPRVCMEDAAKDLLKLVTSAPGGSGEKLRVISIVGYSALGNTLLVDKVYNNNIEVRTQFSLHARVDAAAKNQDGAIGTSNAVDVDQVLSEILKQVSKNHNGAIGTSDAVDVKGKRITKPEETDGTSNAVDVKGKHVMKSEDTDGTSNGVLLTKHLRSRLKDERFLIVIDNVNVEKLKSIIQHCGYEGDGIFIATTDYTEAIHCNCSSLGLDSSTSASQYLMINELMIKGMTDKEYQQETVNRKEELQSMLVSNYKKSLSSLDLQQCLLYFCMFPHAHHVRWNLLLMRYLAEGIAFDQPEEQIDGKFCSPLKRLKEFMDQHDVQPIQVSKNGVFKRCQLPVMVLNHISSESKSKSFFTLCCSSTDIADDKDHVRRLSLHPKSAQNGTLSLPNARDLSRLHTLAVFHTGRLDKIEELSSYDLLRVLDLKECAVLLTEEHLKKICDLVLLRYLSLGDSIVHVPRKIAKLDRLETLDMTKTKTVFVPVEVMELPRLKHLLGKFQLYKDDITTKKRKELLTKKSQLERLSGFVIGDSKEFQILMKHMKKLSKIKIWYDAQNWTADVSTAIKDFIGKGHSLNVDNEKKGSLSIDCKRCPIEFVESLKNPGTLTSLKLCGDLKTFLDFQGSKLTGIEELCLSGTNLSGDEIVRVVRLFRALKYLKLVEDKLRSLQIPADCMHGLQRLCLVGVQIMDGITVQEESLVCLVSLHMLFKTQGDLSGIDITRLENLEEIALHSGVAQAIKEDWQKKASQHKKKPKVLFVQIPELIGGNASNLSDEHSAA